ncbi:MAG: methyltransferase domain-containing protein [Campylobacterota bacterium]|nr:methyltransferase domain-containing protein [Campylobacterota bacterium]
MIFTTQTMFDIITILKEKLQSIDAKDILEFEVINPDSSTSTYSGNIVHLNNKNYIYRGYKAWVDLAQILHCKMLTPKIASDATVIIRFEKLNSDSFHKSSATKEEKYGINSIFSEIHKMEEPSFIAHYIQALKNVNINKRFRILNLGVNSGDEFKTIKQYADNFQNLELIGIDYCPSAIEKAKEKFNDNNISFYTHDINDLSSLNLDKFDLIISIGTLQSSNLEFNLLFMSIVQNYLKKDGAMILGFPNCRWIDGETIYGARVKNYPFSEMGLLYKDAIFCKKYLQQKKFRVTLTGKDYIFLTATSIR